MDDDHTLFSSSTAMQMDRATRDIKSGRNAHAGGPVTLADVLQTVSLAFTDALYDSLRSSRSLRAARLAFRALRNALDGSVRQLKLSPNPGHLLEREVARLPLLSRWPRCSRVHVRIPPCGTTEQAAFLAAVPFAGLTHTARRSVTRLTLTASASSNAEVESLVSSVALRLPALRELDLSGVSGAGAALPRHKQRLLFDALSCLEHLEVLVLPTLHGLEDIGLLADHLKQLLLIAADGCPGGVLTGNGEQLLSRAAAAGISQLSRLESLSISGCQLLPPPNAGDMFDLTRRPPSGVQQLLNKLPSSLRLLQLSGPLRAAEGGTQLVIAAALVDGAFSSLMVDTLNPVLSQSALADAASLLLSCRALGPRLGVLSLPVLRLEPGQPPLLLPVLNSRQDASDAGTSHLRELLRRADAVDVEELWAAPGAPVRPALQLLGKPRRLWLGWVCLYVRAAVESASLATAPAGAAAAEGGSAAAPQQPLKVPSAEAVAAAVLRRLVGGPDLAAAPETAVPGAVIAGQAAHRPNIPADCRMLLLRGPFVSLLLQVPSAAKAWLAGVVSSIGNESLRLQPLPRPVGGAVLLECGRAAGRVAAALLEKAETTSGGSAALEVLPVRKVVDMLLCDEVTNVPSVYLHTLQQELQDLWNGWRRAGGAVNELEALSTLCDLAIGLGYVPPSL